MNDADFERRYTRAILRIVAWFTIGMAADVAAIGLMVGGAPAGFSLPLFVVAGVSDYKLFTMRP